MGDRRTGRRSRASARAAALAAAACVAVPVRCDVVVVGGGAAGLVAALAAARAGASVVVLERGAECGRTILATGNGRCNLANAGIADACAPTAPPVSAYRNAAFAAAVLGTTPTADIVRFFDGLGLAVTDADADGRLYPASRVAESVRAVLLDACEREGVTLACAREARAAARVAGGGVTLAFDELWEGGGSATVVAAALVIASGGCLTGGAGAFATAVAGGRGKARRAHGVRTVGGARAGAPAGGWTGASDPDGPPEGAADALGLAVGLGLPVVPARPALCPLACEGVPVALDGRRVRCAATLLRDGAAIARETGEVLFRAYGLSGIVVFNLSRVAEPGDVVTLDLAPSWSSATLAERLRTLAAADVAPDVQLAGLIDPVIAREIVGRAHAESRPGTPCARRVAVRHVKNLSFTVTGAADVAHAQVTRGGVDVAALDRTTLAALDPRAAGVYVCGEAVDVDGPCGGFNLAWAWKSGLVAGAAAARGTDGVAR